MKSRSASLSRAFRDVDLEINGRKLRAPTAGSIDLLQQIGNPLFVADDETPVETSSLLPLFEFIWIHSAPLAEVLAAAEIEGEINRQARAFAFETPVEDVEAFTEAFGELQERLAAAMTEAIPEGDEGKPAPSPTGSRRTSSTSEVPATGIASVGSSGACHSSEGFNTSTPASATTAPPASGSPEISNPIPPVEIPLPSSLPLSPSGSSNPDSDL